MTEHETDFSETLENVLSFATRRKWCILLPACAIALSTIAVQSLLPDRYSSEATLIMQQQVLQRYVLSPAATSNAEVVQAMTRQVLSRTHLLGVIEQFALYAEERQKNATPEAIVARMRKDIDLVSLDPLTQTDFNAFKIAFTANDPRVAQKVTSRLTQLFIDENLATRENQAASTSNFLNEQLETARQKLAQQEQRLREFKTRHPGELAEQQSANIAALTDLRIQMQGTKSSLNRAQQQRASLESSVGWAQARLRSERAALLTLYTPRHPQVVKKDAEIAKADGLIKVLKSNGLGPERSQLPSPEDPALMELVRQVEANAREIDDLSRQDLRLASELGQYQQRLNLTPLREQELAEIVRDYDLHKQEYADLLKKQQQSQLAVNLEESREGVQFRLIDPPSLPVRPSGPKRVKISLGGLAIGLIAGLGLAFFVHSGDRSFHSERALRQQFAFPLVLGIPLLLTPAERRLRIWIRALGWLAASVMMLAVGAAEFYVFRHG